MIKTVTITGADDGVDPGELVRLSEQYPFLEWGILRSVKREGTPRYPSSDWCEEVSRSAARSMSLHLAAHLCGALTDAVLKGVPPTMRREGAPNEVWVPEFFDRIQVNSFTPTLPFLQMAPKYPRLGWILQARDSWGYTLATASAWIIGSTRAAVLWDPSGGRGIESSVRWPERLHETIIVGGAGGLTSETILAAADRAPSGYWWLDLESGVRTDDRFDLDKVRAVAEAMAPRCIG